MKVFKIIEAIIYIIIILFFVWVFASWIDVLIHQMHGGTNAVWNFFVIGLKIR